MPGQISAIVPTYNRSAFLDEALCALESQQRPPSQIIEWDDGSTDGTPEVVPQRRAASPIPILYRRSANGGKSRALNAALDETTGDYIWICDDDDISLPGAGRSLAQALETTGYGIAAGRHLRFRDASGTGERIMDGTGYWPDLSEGSVLRHLLEDIFFFQNATLVRRDLYDRVGGFREDLARSIDYEMFVRLAARSPVAMVDDVMFHQRKHDGARGPSSARHAAGSSETVWLENDRAIFAAFRALLPLSLYAAFFEGANAAAQHRAGLLERGCVYARRRDWDAAREDFGDAAAMAHAGPIGPVERAILLRAMAGKHGADEACEAPVSARLAELRQLGVSGREMAQALAHGAQWRLRAALTRRDAAEAARIARVIWKTSRGRVGGAAPPPTGLSERRTLPAEAYRW